MGGSVQTGDAAPRRPALRRQRGFTYLWLLLALAIGAAGLAALGQRASAAAQRDREAELIFRGQAIADAISAYWSATAGDAKVLPATLDELLDDRRGPRPLHHLRRLYADPFTGRPEWVLVRGDAQRIAGVHSRSEIAAMRIFDLPPPAAGRVARVSDRVFMSEQAASAASATGAAGVAGVADPTPDRSAPADPEPRGFGAKQ